MTAKTLTDQLGDKLIGRTILTVPMGTWPGGFAEIIKLTPDPGAPEISFQVKSELHGEIGVFENEHVILMEIV